MLSPFFPALFSHLVVSLFILFFLVYNTRGKARGKRQLDDDDSPEIPPPKRHHGAEDDDSESAIASLLGLADAAEAAPAAKNENDPSSRILSSIYPRQVPAGASIAAMPPYSHFGIPGFVPGRLPGPAGQFDPKGAHALFGAPFTAPVSQPMLPLPAPAVKIQEPRKVFANPQAALAAIDAAISALSATKRCATHMAIAYSIHYRQKKQELSQLPEQDASGTAKFMNQFSLDPTSVARALKEKSETQRAPQAAALQPGQLPQLSAAQMMLAAQQAGLAAQFPPGLYGPKLAFPGMPVPSDVSELQALQLQLQLAQQYQMPLNPGMLPQLQMLPYMMRPVPGVPPGSGGASAAAPVKSEPPAQAVVSAVSAIAVVPAEPTAKLETPEPPKQAEDGGPVQTSASPECVTQATTELAVRSFGALLNGISSPDSVPAVPKPANDV